MSDVTVTVLDETNIQVEVTEAESIEVVEVGEPGPTGPIGLSLLTGAGAPSNGNGVDGDKYINTANGDLYLKVSGSWGSPIANITGPQGIQGMQGIQGIQGLQGIQGPQGIQGATNYVGNIDGGVASSIFGGSLQTIDGGNA